MSGLLKEHGLIGGGGGQLKESFGDGSDGILNLTNIQPIVTAPNGGDINTLFDEDPTTYFTTNSVINDDVILDMVFDEPFTPTFIFSNLRWTGTSGNILIRSSDDGISYTTRTSMGINNINKDTVEISPGNAIAKYWRLTTASSVGVITYIGNLSIKRRHFLVAKAGDKSNSMHVEQCNSIYIGENCMVTTSFTRLGYILFSQGDVIIDGELFLERAHPSRVELPLLSLGKTYEDRLALTKQIQDLVGGGGGNGGYGGGVSGGSRAGGGEANVPRALAGGYGGGGGGGCITTTLSAGNGGSIDLAYPDRAWGTWTPGINKSAYHSSNHFVIIPGIYGSGGVGGTSGASGTNYALSGYGAPCAGGGGGGSGAAYASSTAQTSPNAGSGGYSAPLILIIAKGNIIINGVIKSVAGVGGRGGNAKADVSNTITSGGGGGGGTGGGVVALLYRGGYTNNGIIDVSGGAGGSGGNKYGSDARSEAGGSGTSGSIGTIHIQKI